jgi:hypothetical protein
MKKTKGIVQTKRRVRRQAGLSDPDFRALLDHLGRLLAQEYAALLIQPRTADTTAPREDLQ